MKEVSLGEDNNKITIKKILLIGEKDKKRVMESV